jgi:hypothetical protein
MLAGCFEGLRFPDELGLSLTDNSTVRTVVGPRVECCRRAKQRAAGTAAQLLAGGPSGLGGSEAEDAEGWKQRSQKDD